MKRLEVSSAVRPIYWSLGVKRLISGVSWHHLWRWNWQCVPKRQHMEFRCRGITRK